MKTVPAPAATSTAATPAIMPVSAAATGLGKVGRTTGRRGALVSATAAGAGVVVVADGVGAADVVAGVVGFSSVGGVAGGGLSTGGGLSARRRSGARLVRRGHLLAADLTARRLGDVDGVDGVGRPLHGDGKATPSPLLPLTPFCEPTSFVPCRMVMSTLVELSLSTTVITPWPSTHDAEASNSS